MEAEENTATEFFLPKFNGAEHNVDSRDSNYQNDRTEITDNVLDQEKLYENTKDSQRDEIDEESEGGADSNMRVDEDMDASVSNDDFVSGETELARQYAEYMASRQKLGGNSDLAKQYAEYMENCETVDEDPDLAKQYTESMENHQSFDGNPDLAKQYAEYMENSQAFDGNSDLTKQYEEYMASHQKFGGNSDLTKESTEYMENSHSPKVGGNSDFSKQYEEYMAGRQKFDGNSDLTKQYEEYMKSHQKPDEDSDLTKYDDYMENSPKFDGNSDLTKQYEEYMASRQKSDGNSDQANKYEDYVENSPKFDGNSELSKQYEEYMARQQAQNSNKKKQKKKYAAVKQYEETAEDSNSADHSNSADPYAEYRVNHKQMKVETQSAASDEVMYMSNPQQFDKMNSTGDDKKKKGSESVDQYGVQKATAGGTSIDLDPNLVLARQYMEYMDQLHMLEQLQAGMAKRQMFKDDADGDEEFTGRAPKRLKFDESVDEKYSQDEDLNVSKGIKAESLVKKLNVKSKASGVRKFKSESAKSATIDGMKANGDSVLETPKSGNDKGVTNEGKPIFKQYVKMAATAAPLLSDADEATADDNVEDEAVRKEENKAPKVDADKGEEKSEKAEIREKFTIPDPDMLERMKAESERYNHLSATNSMIKPVGGDPGTELLTPMEIYSNLLIQMEATGELLGPPLEAFEKPPEGTPKPPGVVEKVKRFACSECNKEYATSSSLRKHMYSHCEEKPHKCKYCNKGFTESSSLKSHEYIHTGEKPLKCHFCNQGFRSPSNLRRHFRVHTGEKPFKCEVCGKEFSQTVRLQSHMLLHTGETPYKCKYCSKGFRTPNQLNSHHRTHTGERPFKCTMCDKTFSDSSNLRTHVRRHIGDKPHECEVCHVLFGFISDLKRHMLTHTKTKPFICPHCNKGFTQSYTLNAHVAIHTGEGLHKCPVCDRNFTTGTNLRRHLLRHPEYLEANPDVATEVHASTAGGPRHSVMRIYETASGEQVMETPQGAPVPNGVISPIKMPGTDEVTSKIVDSVLAEAYALGNEANSSAVDGTAVSEPSAAGAGGASALVSSDDDDRSDDGTEPADIQSMVNRILGQSVYAKSSAPFANSGGAPMYPPNIGSD